MAKTTNMVEVAVSKLRPYERNAKKHPSYQLEKLVQSIQEFGFISPCLIDKENNIIAGHGRVEAAKMLGMETVPCVYIEGLSEEQRRAFIIADNRLTELGGWDFEVLQEELKELDASGFDIGLTGFELELDPEEKEAGTEINPTLTLPESRVFVFSISAFGTNSEKFIEIQLTPSEAEHLLERVEQMEVAEVGQAFREAINGL